MNTKQLEIVTRALRLIAYSGLHCVTPERGACCYSNAQVDTSVIPHGIKLLLRGTAKWHALTPEMLLRDAHERPVLNPLASPERNAEWAKAGPPLRDQLGAGIEINPLLAGLDDVRSFIDGFADDDCQQPGSVRAYLETLKQTETLLRRAHTALRQISRVTHTLEGCARARNIAQLFLS